MIERKQWLNDAWQKHYRTYKEFVYTIQKNGWKGLTYDRAKNWMASGYLPNSLTPDNYTVIAKTLDMTLLDMMRLEGYPIHAEINDVEIPGEVADYVLRLCTIRSSLLRQMAPALEKQLDVLIELLD